jgi:lysophospholipase L1-like esterase
MKKNLLILWVLLLAGVAAWADTITINTTQYTATRLASPTTYAATNTGVFTYYGWPTTNFGSEVQTLTHDLVPFPPLQVSFDLTGTNCELLINSYNNVAGGWDMAYFTLSDGATTTIYTNIPDLGPGSSPYYVNVAFGSNITHHLLLSIKGGFNGVNVSAGNVVALHTLSKPNLLIVEGDSYVQGFNPTLNVYGYNSYWFDGYVWQLAKLLPNTIAIPSGLGGTGFVANNGGLTTNYSGRVVQDILSVYTNAVNSGLYNQIFVTAAGTINDLGMPTNTVFQQVTNVMSLIESSCPKAKVFMIGNWMGVGGEQAPGPNDYALEWAMTNAAAVLGLPIFDPIPANLKNANNYYTFYPSGDTDSVHPSAAGYAIYAGWLNTNLANVFGTNWNATAQNGAGALPTYILTVNGGSGSGTYTNGQIVSITASNYPGSYFTNWAGQGVLNSNLSTTTVTMPAANITVTANFAVPSSGASLNVTSFGAVGDVETFSVHTVSNSVVASVIGTNTFTSADVGKVIEVFRAGPWVSYNGSVIVTQQDIICTITNVTQGTNLYMSIPAGWTTNAYCVVGNNNAQAFQATINAAASLVSSGATTNVTINIPAGTFLLCSTYVLNPNYVMDAIGDTHPAISIASGGITLLGAPGGGTVLMGCGAGMNHLVNPMYPANEAPYVPMRDTLIYCQGPVTNSQYPLVFQNVTFDGGLTNGAQNYSYWMIHQGDGSGWDTTHHAIADSGSAYNVNGTLVQWQMHQLKVFTNCTFQHWRGEMLICWTADITNAFNDIANCTFWDGNATADNMYYGQHVHGCTFNTILKVMEYYQYNASFPTVFENNMWTNLINDGGSYYALTLVGATTNATPPSFTISNNIFHDESGMNAIQFSPAANVSVVGNSFIGSGAGIVFTSAGVQPSDGSAIPVMTNFFIANNTFSNSANPLSMDGYSVANVLISNNVGIAVNIAAGYKTNIDLAYNTGGALNAGPATPGSGTGIQAGNYCVDETNNAFLPLYLDNGGYAVTDTTVSYGNGRVHLLKYYNSTYYLDDSSLNPPGAILAVEVNTYTGQNITNFYLSATSPGTPRTLINGTTNYFHWIGDAWSSFDPSLHPPTIKVGN